MPSTYTLNNGIELIATGEQSGTWGDTTNLNLGLVDTALDGQVTVTLAAAGSSGAPNALPISDGSASNGRNRLIIFADGGDLGATAFVQLTPNDAKKIVYIRNNLSGGRAITLFQGTYNASNDYEVPAGTTAVVFFNGGGAGAVAANVFNNALFDSLRLGGVSVTAILDEDNMSSDSATALATQQSIKAYVDAEVGANNELSEILANGNTSGGTNIQMTTTDEVQFRDAGLKINSSVDGQLDIDADVELEITAPTVDINASTAVTIDTTTLTMTGSVNVVGDLDVDNLNINGNAIISTNTNGNIDLTPNGVGEVNITKVDINGGTIDGTVIGGASAAAATFTNVTANGTINLAGATVSNGGSVTTIDINGGTIDGTVIGGSTPAAISGTTGQFGTSLNVDGTVTADGLTVSTTSAVTASFSRDGTDGDAVQIFNGGVGTTKSLGLGVSGTHGTINSQFGGVFIQPSGVTSAFFGTGGDISFFEDTGTTPKFYWDASAERLGLGTTTPTATLSVTENANISLTSGTGQVRFEGAGYSGFFALDGTSFQIGQNAGSRSLTFHSGSGMPERLRITSTGSVGIGTSSPTAKLQVHGLGAVPFRWGDTSALGTLTYAGSDPIIQSNTGNLLFFGLGTERARIDASGLLVGTTSADPAGSNVFGAALLTFGGASLSRNNSITLDTNRDGSDGTIINLRKAGTTVGSISVTASATAYNTSSDYRLKEDVQPMSGASDRVLALNPVNFAWKVDGTRVDGFLAHEAQAVVPEAVTGEKDGDEMQAIDQSKLVPLLTAALQEALQKIDALEARITALEA